ncbi:MAG: cupin domain-containing protein [Aquabacterium sp.]|uniref:cupin domain-containing protein n=1 Tax=Aquabacterium sp. TaxID=1872578 RepID=UPI001D21777E|nr:cupin domain-containing protein [Aquabacterium sp.]MBT9610551.1 cupin domain-containing protein [Aquabacterium sp.]
MNPDRIYNTAQCFQPSDGEPIRSVVAETAECVIVAWHVKPGQRIAAHTHPHGQDTWTILAGQGQYVVGAAGESRRVAAGDIAVASTGQVHGVLNDGDVPLLFVSVVAPASAGYELL